MEAQVPYWLLVILLCLATYRATRLILDDRIFAPYVAKLQGWAEARYEAKFTKRNPGSRLDESDEWRSNIAYLFSCPWCVSAYTGAAVIFLTDLATSVPLPWLVWAVASAVTAWLSSLEHKLFDD